MKSGNLARFNHMLKDLLEYPPLPFASTSLARSLGADAAKVRAHVGDGLSEDPQLWAPRSR